MLGAPRGPPGERGVVGEPGWRWAQGAAGVEVLTVCVCFAPRQLQSLMVDHSRQGGPAGISSDALCPRIGAQFAYVERMPLTCLAGKIKMVLA